MISLLGANNAKLSEFIALRAGYNSAIEGRIWVLAQIGCYNVELGSMFAMEKVVKDNIK